jgi:hypothetical protein
MSREPISILVATIAAMACAGVPAKKPVALTVDQCSYDGRYFEARVLVQAGTSPATVDRRFVPNFNVEAIVQKACSGETAHSEFADFFPQRATAADLVLLAPKEWFGTQMRWRLFPDESAGPDCIDVEVTYLPVDVRDRRDALRTHVLIKRTPD